MSTVGPPSVVLERNHYTNGRLYTSKCDKSNLHSRLCVRNMGCCNMTSSSQNFVTEFCIFFRVIIILYSCSKISSGFLGKCFRPIFEQTRLSFNQKPVMLLGSMSRGLAYCSRSRACVLPWARRPFCPH